MSVDDMGGPTEAPGNVYDTRAREAVARGVALLDRQRPGWADRIDVDRLQLHNPFACVLGQVYGPGYVVVEDEEMSGYAAGMHDLFGPDWLESPDSDDFHYGFNVGRGMPSFDMLRREWVAAIVARQG